MKVSFLLGPAGSGKTRSCLEGMRRTLASGHRGPDAILLVPEQMTFQTEAEIARLVGPSPRAHVLSFQRLAVRVFAAVGGAARPRLDELGRKMVLRAILEEHRQELELFGKMADKPGFLDLLSRSLRELRAFGQGPRELAGTLAQLQAHATVPYLGPKLRDLAIVMEALETHLEGRFTDPDLTLDLLAARIGQARLVAGAEVWVDGFFGFTPQEYRVLSAIIERAQEVRVALCLDDREGLLDYPEDALFRPTLDTYAHLLELAVKHGFDTATIHLKGGVPPRFSRSPALARVELEVASAAAGGTAAGTPDDRGAAPIVLVRAPDRRSEITAVATEILRLCREEGYRYREIAVVTRDLAAYHDLAEGIFEALAIPHFIDGRRSVAHHPAIELIRSGLEVLSRNWPTDAVVRYLKTDLAPVSRPEVDLLENFVLEHGIQGRRWIEGEWAFHRRSLDVEDAADAAPPAAGLERLEQLAAIRIRATSALTHLAERLGAARTVADHCRAVFELLSELDVASTLEQWENPGAAQEHGAVYAGLIELLDQTVSALGPQNTTLRGFAAILEAGLSGLQLGRVPPTRDQVLFGAIERSRHPEIRAMFIVGAQLGSFPRSVPEDSFLDDSERQHLARAGCEVGPASRTLLFHERYLLYIAATRASDRLYLSYPLIDAEGRALVASQLFSRLEGLGGRVRDLSVDPAGLEGLVSSGQLAEAIALHLRAGRTEPWPEIARWAHLRFPEAMQPVASALAPRRSEAPLEPAMAEALMLRRSAGHFVTSVSRLESYAACPFQYFARFGLRLAERRHYGLEPSDVGILEHAALRQYVQAMGVEPAAGQAAAERDRLIAEIAGRLAQALKGAILLDSGRNRHLLARITRTLQEAAATLAEHDRRGRFRAASLEIAFGPEGDLAPLVVPLEDGAELWVEGQIDRLDHAELAGVPFVRVIDYKRSHRSFSVGEAALGLTLQLPVYLAVARRSAGRSPAGMLYFPVRGGWIDAPMDADAARRKLLQHHRARGLVLAEAAIARLMEEPAGPGYSDLLEIYWKADGTLGSASKVATADQFEALERHSLDAVAGCVGRIRHGEVDPEPYRIGLDRTPCTYCDYRVVCRFDPTAGDRPRQLVVPGAEEAWGRIDPGTGPAAAASRASHSRSRS